MANKHYAPIKIHRNLGWEKTPEGQACWKVVGFHVTVGNAEITPLVWGENDNYLAGKKIYWYYSGAPAPDDAKPAYHPKAFSGLTKAPPDNDGAHFTISGEHNVAPDAAGPDWVWVAAGQDGIEYGDAVSGLGLRVNTNHLVVSPIFKRVIKTGDPQDDEEHDDEQPDEQPQPDRPAPAPQPAPQPGTNTYISIVINGHEVGRIPFSALNLDKL